MIEIRVAGEDRKKDINIPNEPFALFGRMVPSYVDEKWGYSEILFEQDNISDMCFPDENYDYDAMKNDHVFLGAYDGDTCVGLAILRDAVFYYMYLYELKVSKAYRRQGVGHLLIEKAKDICAARGYKGLYTQGQDTNLAACRFYLNAGFHIGGLNTDIYKGSRQEGKSDILFYLDF